MGLAVPQVLHAVGFMCSADKVSYLGVWVWDLYDFEICDGRSEYKAKGGKIDR